MSQQRNDLGPFKRHGGPLRVVLIIGVRSCRGFDDGVEVILK